MYHSPMNGAQFSADCEEIVDGWLALGAKDGGAPWLEREAYELISYMLDRNELHLWEHRRSLLERRGRPVEENVFSQGLRVIFAKRPDAINSHRRSLSAVRLKHAYDHFVPVPFLNGFLQAIGGRPEINTVEKGFDVWVAYMYRYSGRADANLNQLTPEMQMRVDLVIPDLFPELRSMAILAGAAERSTEAASD